MARYVRGDQLCSLPRQSLVQVHTLRVASESVTPRPKPALSRWHRARIGRNARGHIMIAWIAIFAFLFVFIGANIAAIEVAHYDFEDDD